MSTPKPEPQVTDFETVTQEMENEGTPFATAPEVTEQDPASEGAPADNEPAAEPVAEPTPEPAAEPAADPAADPEADPETPPEVTPDISEEAQKMIDEANARAAAADRAANLERRQREDLAARVAGVKDRDARMAYAARLQKALSDPELQQELIEEQAAAATANAPVPEHRELEIRTNERQRFGAQMMEQLRDRLNLTGLTEAQLESAYSQAKIASGKDVPYAQDVLAAEVQIVSGTTSSTVADRDARIVELEAQIAANGGEVAGARLRTDGGPEQPSEAVAGRSYSPQQIEDMTEAQWDANEASILAAEAKRLQQLKAAEQSG